MRVDLAGQVALVTGASQGIGVVIAEAMAEAGARVVLAARREAELEAAAAAIGGAGGEAVALPVDVSDETAVDALFREAEQAVGPVSVLVNNAGIAGPVQPIGEIAPEDWRETLAINLTGPWLCCRAAVPGMIARGSGRVINIGSISGKRPLANRTPYCASKMGLLGLTRALALELGPHNINVNCISPGAVETPRLTLLAEKAGMPLEDLLKQVSAGSALRRVSQSADIAAMAVFLASEAAQNVTGQDFTVDAGTFMD